MSFEILEQAIDKSDKNKKKNLNLSRFVFKPSHINFWHESFDANAIGLSQKNLLISSQMS
ncbi:MAG: hypothetical protein ACTSRI_09250 [Promethearchaeota archaeon]